MALGKKELLCSLLADGLIGGVGGILVFLPNIILLFFFISLLEATGYMSRVAFLMDALMQKLCGVQGKAIIPLVLGFGCNVPAILATRSMESQRSRWITISVLPLMSCGARLPIYTLMTSVFFDLKWQPVVILGIYLLGIILAVVAAKILAIFWKNPVKETILLELPPYRWPPMKNVFFQVADYTKHFLLRAGTFILAASILLWALSTFPVKREFSQDYSAEIATLSVNTSWTPEIRQEKIHTLKMAEETERYNYTWAGRIGSGLEPVFRPLGFDKKIILSLLGAVASKELFVSQIQMLYFFDDSQEGAVSNPLREAYTPLESLCVMVFCLIGIPCIGTLAVVRQETGSWKWAIAQWCCLTFLAWILTFCLFQIGSLGCS